MLLVVYSSNAPPPEMGYVASSDDIGIQVALDLRRGCVPGRTGVIGIDVN